MELNITDLLDDLQDISPDIHTKAVACEQRVKELTLMKIHRENNTVQRKPGRIAVRAALIAAVLACLSVTVLAVVGEYIPQWLENHTEETIGYDNDLYIGSASKNWGIEGWQMELKAENATPIGLTMVCAEWGGEAHSGVLTTDDSYWLEIWNGSGYEIYLPEKTPSALGDEATIQKNAIHSWAIGWEECYGALAPGHYRLGKNFEHISDSGHSQNLVGYVKFRVLDENMADSYAQYETAVKELSDQSAWHLTYQVFPENPDGYESYAMEIWRSGENYLQNLSYLDENGTVLKQEGTALQGGVGYRLNWNDGATVWCKIDSSVDENTFYLWQTFSCMSPTGIDEIKKTGDTIVYIESADSLAESNWETAVTFTNAGQILDIKQYSIHGDNNTLYSVLAVHDTDPEQIAQTIADQKPKNEE